MDVSAARERQAEARTTGPGLARTRQIRPAREDELDEIAALFPPALAPYRGTAADAALDAYLHELVAGARSRWDGGECYVAVVDGRVVGSVVFYPDVALEGWSNLPAGWAGFRALVVAPDARGCGVGRALDERCLARARETGAPVLGIHSAEVLSDAVRLYERLGFARCPEYDLS